MRMPQSAPRSLFVYKRGGLDTAEIRGRQVAQALGCDAIPLRELTLELAKRYAAIIYVKHLPAQSLLREIRSAGVRQVMDVLDNYSDWRLASKIPVLDALIGANLTQKVHLAARYGKPSVEIPHHHCNFDELRVPMRSGPPKLGFISTPDTWPVNRKLAMKTGYEIVSNVSRKGKGGFKNLIESYMAVDIGFAWRMDSNKLRFNCANKLTNFMSFGIPSVLTPESGYLEYGRHGETVLYAYDKNDFVDLLRWLAEDRDQRQKMSDACIEAARPFHISRITDHYRRFLSSL